MTTQSKWANTLVKHGYTLFPIAPGTKQAVVKWKSESTSSVSEVRAWWDEFPDDNIGINTGESGLLVVDLDSDEAADTWDGIWDEHEEEDWLNGRWPVVATPRGFHIYMDAGRHEFRNTTSKLGDGIDTRGHGGMVVAPGSKVRGKHYFLYGGDLDRVEPVPAWLRKKLVKPPTLARDPRKTTRFVPPSLYRAQHELKRWCSKIVNAPDGTQNHTINTAAFILSRDFCPPLDPEDVKHELEQAAKQGNHPMSRARPTIESGLGGRRC